MIKANHKKIISKTVSFLPFRSIHQPTLSSILFLLVYFPQFLSHHLHEPWQLLQLLHVLNVLIPLRVDQSNGLLVLGDGIFERVSLFFLANSVIKLIKPAVHCFWLIRIHSCLDLLPCFLCDLIILRNVGYARDVISVFDSAMERDSFSVKVYRSLCD